MAWTIGIVLLIISLFICLVTGIEMIWGLLVGTAAFFFAAVHSGHKPKAVLKMMWAGIKESFIVVGILLIIGAMTGIWRGCGTVQLLVYYGAKLIHPKLFVLFSFLLPAAVSYLLGTSFGTAATIGVVLMTLCSVSGGNPVLTGGAILSGMYFGDRASPASSCAHLVAYLTGTEIYDNVRRMLRDAIPVTILVSIIYLVLSFFFPLKALDNSVLNQLQNDVRLSPLLLIPTLILLIAPIIKLNIKSAMFISIGLACALAVSVQNTPISELPRILFFGYEAKGELKELLSGGGIWSMMMCNFMIIISATYSGIFNGTHALDSAQNLLDHISEKHSLTFLSMVTSLPLIMMTCSQTLALMLQVPLIKPIYEKRGVPSTEFMLDLADTTVLLSGVVPWCLAFSNPARVLGIGANTIPLGFLLFLPAVFRLIGNRKRSN